MGQRAVSDGEIIRTVWEAEDRLRLGARAAIGWDGKGEPEGFARYRRRA